MMAKKGKRKNMICNSKNSKAVTKKSKAEKFEQPEVGVLYQEELQQLENPVLRHTITKKNIAVILCAAAVLTVIIHYYTTMDWSSFAEIHAPAYGVFVLLLIATFCLLKFGCTSSTELTLKQQYLDKSYTGKTNILSTGPRAEEVTLPDPSSDVKLKEINRQIRYLESEIKLQKQEALDNRQKFDQLRQEALANRQEAMANRQEAMANRQEAMANRRQISELKQHVSLIEESVLLFFYSGILSDTAGNISFCQTLIKDLKAGAIKPLTESWRLRNIFNKMDNSMLVKIFKDRIPCIFGTKTIKDLNDKQKSALEKKTYE